jgi:NAD(P)-dependent dehydrogenase (short-subunit alcohol dehydrogenase family)
MSKPHQEESVVAIVGGTTGLGLSAARALVKSGWKVALLGRNPDNLEFALSELGESAVGIAADACDPEAAPTLIENAVKSFGHLDALYHVAGGSARSQGDGPLHELTDEGWQRALDHNLNSLLYSNRAAVRRFREQGAGGVILNMGSVLGFSPSPTHFATHGYAATKAAVIGFTKSIASYYAKEGIRANVVAPALVETPMSERAATNDRIMGYVRSKQPLDGGRIGVPEDLDAAVLYLLSDESKYVTGQVLAVDGGWSVTEGQLDT